MAVREEGDGNGQLGWRPLPLFDQETKDLLWGQLGARPPSSAWVTWLELIQNWSSSFLWEMFAELSDLWRRSLNDNIHLTIEVCI